MDELIGRLATKAGIDDAVAEKTIGIMLDFLRSEGPSDKVQDLIDNIPGAETAIAASSNGGGLATLMGGGLMAAGTKLMALGLGMTEMLRREQPLAVVVVDAAPVRNAPYGGASAAATVPAGGALLVGRRYGAWREVHRGDGIHGWVLDSEIAGL